MTPEERQRLNTLAYRVPLPEMSLTDLHRALGYLQRRQRLVWLHHRADRIRLLKDVRRRRIAALAERRSAQA